MKTSLNLLPLEFRRRQLLRRRLVQWSLAWGGFFFVLLAVGSSRYAAWKSVERTMSGLELRCDPIRKLQSDVEQIQARLNELGARDSLVGRLHELRPAVVALGLVSTSAANCDGRVWLERFTMLQQTSEPSKAKDQPESDAGPRTVGTLALQGAAVDNLEIARFAAALRDTKAFNRVELKSSLGTATADTTSRSYVVECAF